MVVELANEGGGREAVELGHDDVLIIVHVEFLEKRARKSGADHQHQIITAPTFLPSLAFHLAYRARAINGDVNRTPEHLFTTRQTS